MADSNDKPPAEAASARGSGREERRRDEALAAVPRWYRGELHFVAINLLGGLILYLASRDLTRPSWAELAVIPIAFLFANYVEWRVHKGPLHHPGWPRILYQRHTLLHHAAFGARTMAIREPREMRLVLFPFPALFGAALAALPPSLLLGALWSSQAGRLFYLVTFGYYLLYEWCHLAFHLPEGSWLGRNPLVRWLRVGHARHHDPQLMLHKNFNVTFPIWDALLGTLDRGER